MELIEASYARTVHTTAFLSMHIGMGGLHHDWGLYAGEVAEKNITGSSFMGVVTTPPHPLPCMSIASSVKWSLGTSYKV